MITQESVSFDKLDCKGIKFLSLRNFHPPTLLHSRFHLPTADEDEGELDYDDSGPSTSSLDSHTLRPPGKDEIKNGQWLGVNVRSQGPGGMVMVCAHR